MKTIEYNLTSKPGEKIKLPEGTLAHVKHFFSLAESAQNRRNLREMLDNDPYFKDMDIFLKKDLLHTNYKFKKYRLTKYKDLIHVLIGSFEVNRSYKQIANIEGEINKSFNYL